MREKMNKVADEILGSGYVDLMQSSLDSIRFAITQIEKTKSLMVGSAFAPNISRKAKEHLDKYINDLRLVENDIVDYYYLFEAK